jgi:hypothetical protein
MAHPAFPRMIAGGLLAVLLLATGVAGALHPGDRGLPSLPVRVGLPGAGVPSSPSVSLAVAPTSVPAGDPVTVWLNLTGSDCATLSAQLTVVFTFGDGFAFRANNSTGFTSCPSPSTTMVALQYSYHLAGTQDVSAQANWTNATPVDPNQVEVTVTGPSPTAPLLAQDWTLAFGLVLAIGLAAVFWMRRRTRRPPELPASQV